MFIIFLYVLFLWIFFVFCKFLYNYKQPIFLVMHVVIYGFHACFCGILNFMLQIGLEFGNRLVWIDAWFFLYFNLFEIKKKIDQNFWTKKIFHFFKIVIFWDYFCTFVSFFYSICRKTFPVTIAMYWLNWPNLNQIVKIPLSFVLS